MSEIEIIRTASLGDNSYLLIAGDEAALVDPQRDCWRLPQACARRRLEAVSQLLRIGYDEVVGVLDGGLESWHDRDGAHGWVHRRQHARLRRRPSPTHVLARSGPSARAVDVPCGPPACSTGTGSR